MKLTKNPKDREYGIKDKQKISSKDMEQKQEEKICTEQRPERSGTSFQVLPHPEPQRICFLSSIKAKRHVQNVSVPISLV